MRKSVEDAKCGKPEAYEFIVKHFTGMAMTVAFEKLRDIHSAEDAVQEAFTDAFSNLHKLEDLEAFPGWFKVIVERQCYRILRQKPHHMLPIKEFEKVIADNISLETIVERREMQHKLHEAVASLSLNMRLAVQLFYFHGYKIKEISSYLDVSTSVLKKRLYDARKKLKTQLPVVDFISVFNDLYEGGQKVLHIVNGDVVADKLKQGSIQGDILVWREVYSFGPVFNNMLESNNRSIRATFLEQALGIPQNEYITGCSTQEKTLQKFNEYEEVVLWFEHDLYDQSMLSYLLHWFSKKNLGTTKLSLLCIDAFPGIDLFRGIGQLTINQIESLSGTWQTIGREELEIGHKVWEAYTSKDVDKHIEILQEDTKVLHFVRDAFEAHLSRLPSGYNGLGIIEQTTLEMVDSGFNTPYELFKQVGNKLNVLGIGDLEYWYWLAKMSESPYPLLEIAGLVSYPNYKEMLPSFRECTISLTAFGRCVLTGDKDWVIEKGVNDWYGGLHLRGKMIPIHWDSSRKAVVKQ